MPQAPALLARTARPFKALFVSDALAGVLLIVVAAVAVAVANSPLAPAYRHLLSDHLAWTPTTFLVTVHAWVDNGLMAVFFFVVGLEVKREWLVGNLAEPASRRLPIVAALAGMATPAVVYALVAGQSPGLLRGWAIPAATDIAFAMGVIGLLGQRVPPALRTFLLTVAIVDDIGAVVIIASFYTPFVDVDWLNAGLLVLAILVGLNRAGLRHGWPFALGTVALWWCLLHAGIHPTIAGVAGALTIPCRGDDSLLERMEHRLVGWNAYLVMPVFAFANAGVTLAGLGRGAILSPLPLAIAAGLVVGKQAGIFGSVYMADRTGFARRPDASSWPQVWGVALLSGIGFTMSLFIAGLAFARHARQFEEAKLGVLAGTLLSAMIGYAVLRLASTPKAS